MAKDKLVIFRQKLEEALIIGNKQVDVLVSANSSKEDKVKSIYDFHNKLLELDSLSEELYDKYIKNERAN